MNKKLKEVIIIFLICAIVMGGAFYISRNYLVVFPISGDSMEPTISDKEYVLLFKTKKVKFGDIIIFFSTEKDDYLIKRVIGLPDDKIEIKFSEQDSCYYVYRNGEQLVEDYINSAMVDYYEEISLTVPQGKLFFLGDNRNDSYDSHYGILADISQIQGVAFLKYRNWKSIKFLAKN